MKDGHGFPIVDLGRRDDRAPLAAQGAIAAAIRRACDASGFFYVTGHGVPEAWIADAFAANRRFHALPAAAKSALAMNRWHRGYMGFGTAKLTSSARFAPARRPNQMESFFVRHEVAPDDPGRRAGAPLQGPNQWPDDPWFRTAVTRYDAAMRRLGASLLPALSIAAGEAPDYLAARFDPPSTALRLNHYPPAPADRPDDLFGSHPHTDYGFLTILAQDAIGGLEVRMPDGGWRPAPHLPGTFILNIGDAFARWTNDAFNSTPHRVVNASSERDRYSIAYFFDPALETVIECLPRFRSDRPAAYAPVRFVDYFTARLDANYARKE
ncbi:MAG: isopenicillin N synthase family oxygenase [Alphaproteobacteria bacterium]|nr:isopenicillin N synthase family oxygenase [Alphaproteobacteria bacterium]